MNKVLAFDLGGTKLAAAVVSDKGEILESHKEPVQTSGGFEGLVRQFGEMGKTLLQKHPEIKMGGIASAGPLDPVRGVLLDPTNFFTNGESWGVVPLLEKVEKILGIRMKLENDAAAAVLAEHWVGLGANTENLVALTLGTGLGVGIITNGNLLRSGRNLHTEAGHTIIDINTKEVRCGCGNYGCAEAYLSGVNFTKILASRWGESGLSGEDLVLKAKQGDLKALEAFKEYSRLLAIFITNMVVLFSPEKVVLSGGFSEASDLFMNDTNRELESLLLRRRKGVDLMPELLTSKFQGEAGLLGGAYVALKHFSN